MSPRGVKSNPFTAYENGNISAPTVAVVGRSVRGEYVEIARACGGESLRLGHGESVGQLDLLDPMVIFGARSGKATS